MKLSPEKPIAQSNAFTPFSNSNVNNISNNDRTKDDLFIS